MNFYTNLHNRVTILAILLLIQLNSNAQDKYLYKDYNLSFEKRVNDLVSHLTLEEKVSQMLNASPAIPRLGIPAYDWWNETLHGVARTPYKVTVYHKLSRWRLLSTKIRYLQWPIFLH